MKPTGAPDGIGRWPPRYTWINRFSHIQEASTLISQGKLYHSQFNNDTEYIYSTYFIDLYGRSSIYWLYLIYKFLLDIVVSFLVYEFEFDYIDHIRTLITFEERYDFSVHPKQLHHLQQQYLGVFYSHICFQHYDIQLTKRNLR